MPAWQGAWGWITTHPEYTTHYYVGQQLFSLWKVPVDFIMSFDSVWNTKKHTLLWKIIDFVIMYWLVKESKGPCPLGATDLFFFFFQKPILLHLSNWWESLSAPLEGGQSPLQSETTASHRPAILTLPHLQGVWRIHSRQHPGFSDDILGPEASTVRGHQQSLIQNSAPLIRTQVHLHLHSPLATLRGLWFPSPHHPVLSSEAPRVEDAI